LSRISFDLECTNEPTSISWQCLQSSVAGVTDTESFSITPGVTHLQSDCISAEDLDATGIVGTIVMALLCCCKSPRHLVDDRRDRELWPPQLYQGSSRAPSDDGCPTPPIRSVEACSGPRIEPSSTAIFSATPVGPYRGPSDLEDLVVDDSDCEEDQRALGKRASATWDAVRSRLTRHISLESTFKKPPPSLTGHSQEEIERRAELRRLMHKRIQDELLCDDSVAESCTDNKRTSHKSSLNNINQSRGGPRDTIEFIVKSNENPVLCTHRSKVEGKAAESDAERAISQNSQASQAEVPVGDASQVQGQLILDRLCLEGNEGCTTPASRCNHQADQTCFEPAGQPNSASSTRSLIRSVQAKSDSRESQSWDTQSVLAMWLQSQISRSREPSSAKVESIESGVRGKEELEPQFLTDSQTCELSHHRLSVPPHGKSSRSVSVTKHDFLPSAADSHRHAAGCSGAMTFDPRAADENDAEDPRAITLTHSQDLAQSYAVAMAFDRVEDTSSSAYPSVIPSIQTSPMTSQTNMVYSLNDRDLQSMVLMSPPCELIQRSSWVCP
jgi:hypothetical protein